MKEKDFIIKKISALLYDFDIVTIEAVHISLTNLKRRREVNENRRTKKAINLVNRKY